MRKIIKVSDRQPVSLAQKLGNTITVIVIPGILNNFAAKCSCNWSSFKVEAERRVWPDCWASKHRFENNDETFTKNRVVYESKLNLTKQADGTTRDRRKMFIPRSGVIMCRSFWLDRIDFLGNILAESDPTETFPWKSFRSTQILLKILGPVIYTQSNPNYRNQWASGMRYKRVDLIWSMSFHSFRHSWHCSQKWAFRSKVKLNWGLFRRSFV